MFDKSKIKTLPLSQRKNKTSLDIMINPSSVPENPKKSENLEKIINIAENILSARKNSKSVIMFFGAHLIKNGLSLVLREMIENNYITHLATNGAGSIHDWEFAYRGKTEEDVRENVQKGQFGLWEETGKYINLAVIEGAKNDLGYGEAIGKMIDEDKIGKEIVKHLYKRFSVQEYAYYYKIPFTVHVSVGQDITHIHPLCDGGAIGKTSMTDFYKFAKSVYNIEGGIYLSVGSGTSSPMVFEKALSIAKNVGFQENKNINNFIIVVNDIQDSGGWDWKSEKEPPKSSPAYYLRFCKTFNRMKARELCYINEDNRIFLTNLYHELKKLDK